MSDLKLMVRKASYIPETLKGKFAESTAAVIREELGDLDKVVSKELETKVWGFLETRAALLLKAYETSVEVCLNSGN